MARTVLLADDSVTAQNMGRRILMDAGYDVITVNNGSAALKKVHENRPDLIVLDVYMPGYGGLEVCQRLKESGETMRIPVLLTVGKMEPFKAEEARRVRADGHIVKPFEANELLAALTKLEDKIVPQPDTRSRKGKSEKKTRTWHVDTDPAAVPEEWTEKIEHLASTKQRLVNREPEPAAVALDPVPSVETVPPRKSIAPAEPAPEMPVVAGASGIEQEQGTSVVEGVATAAEAQSPEQALVSPPVDITLEPHKAPSANSEQPQASLASASAPQIESSETAIHTVIEPPPTAVAGEAESSVPLEPESQGGAFASQTPAEAMNHATPRWVAQSVALNAEEAAVELEQEMKQSQMHATAAKESQQSSPVQEAPALSSDTTIVSHEASFAAAASAASSSMATSVATPVGEEGPEPAGSEAAAAWQNWQQIRDSVMTPQNAAVFAESLASAAKLEASATHPAIVESENNNGPSVTSIESEALASIVDSVLAELKPKLMQEIAKKLKK